MKINKKEVLEQELIFFDSEINRFPYLKDIKEHYRLLTYISKINNNITILDVGTNFGHSCLSLAQNKNNKVVTYDIYDKSFLFFKEYKNVEFKNLDINKESAENIKQSPIILLDIDPHDGIQEEKFTNFLKEINYKGYLICDDIFLNDGMKKWWDSINIEKYDVTEVGHFSGTGIINFNEDGKFEFND